MCMCSHCLFLAAVSFASVPYSKHRRFNAYLERVKNETK